MKTVKQLLNFIESYDVAEATEKKICKEIIDLKFSSQPKVIKTTVSSLPANLLDNKEVKRAHRSLIGVWNIIKTCPECGQRYRTYFARQRFCSRKCFGKDKSTEALKKAKEIKPLASNDKLWKPR